MPRTRPADMDDVEAFAYFKHLEADPVRVRIAVEGGAALDVEETLADDAGEDYSKLMLDGKQIGYWPGY